VRFARAFLLLVPFAAAIAQQRAYSLTGQVVFDDGAPVAGAEIELSTSSSWEEAADPVLTDAQGRFAFAGLPEGVFVLTAHRNDLGTFHWGQRPQSWLVGVLSLNEHFPHQAIVFRIERFGSIAGTVRDAAGNPMPNMHVSAARRTWSNGKAAMQLANFATTDDLGRFRLPSLPRGRYRVCVASPQGGAPAPPVGYAPFGQSSRKLSAGTCQPDERARNLLELAPGRKLDMDFVLSPREPVEVSGRVTNSPEGQNVYVQMQSVESSANMLTAFVPPASEAHTFRIENVLPGRYWLSANATSNEDGVQTPLAARIPIAVGDSPVADVELTLAPLPAVNVVIHAPSDAGAISVALRDADEPLGGATQAQRQADGSLRIALQHSGRYWLVARTPLCATAAHLGKADALDHALDIVPSMKDPLEVTFSNQCGDIRATIVNSTGDPVPHGRLLILLSGTPDDPGDLDLITADDDGRMLYNGLTPGKYTLWAWTEVEEWNGAVDDLTALKDRQTTVEVAAGDKLKVRVPLLSAFRQVRK
jgi:hypothetical protein